MWGIIFHKALCIYPKHSGGKSNNKIFTALNSWFYGGFKKREKLSKCRISSPHAPSTLAVFLNVYRYLVCVPHLYIRNTRMKASIRPLLGHLFLVNTINDVFHHYLPFIWQLLTGG